jgi:hypothetical protein
MIAKHPSLFVICLISTIASISAFAQAPSTDGVQGYSGQIVIFPNARLGQTTVVLQSDTAVSPSSSQIVFVLQSEAAQPYPSAWSGRGRVLIANGAVVVQREGGTGNQNLDFQFAAIATPSPIKDWPLQKIPVYGIARYGEMKPLTAQQIANLEETGNIQGVQQPRLTPEQDPGKASVRGVQSLSAGESGGIGALSCAISTGASVGCRSGYHASCSDATRKAVCEKNP